MLPEEIIDISIYYSYYGYLNMSFITIALN